MIRNSATTQYFHVITFNTDGRVSGAAATITCKLSKDSGTRVATNDVNPTEIESTGEYVFTLTQSETDAYELSFTPESSTSGVQCIGLPSNVIYTTSGLNPTFVVPQIVIDQASLPEGTSAVYQASQWDIMIEGIPDTEYANMDGILFGVKSEDEADADMPLQIRWDKAGDTTEVLRVAGAAPTGTLDDDGAVITHEQYTDGDTFHRFTLVVEGEVTLSVPTTNSLNSVTGLGSNLNFARRNGYSMEWKFVGDTDLVVSASYLIVNPTVNRTVE